MIEETIPASPKTARPSRWRALFFAVAENPVILKELRKRMRGRQAYIMLFVYLLVISAFMTLIYATMLLNNMGSYRWDPQARQALGKSIFGVIVLTELLLIVLIAPSLTSGAIAAEREHQTLDLLRTTLLSARALVWGKLGSAFSFIFLLIFSAVPLQSLAFLLGGVGWPELIISSLLMTVTAFFFCALGLFFSSFLKRAAIANTAVYTLMGISTITIAVAFFVLSVVNSSSSLSHYLPEEIASMVIWFLVCTNAPLAGIISEVLLMDSQGLFFTTHGPFGTTSFPLPSPWIPCIIIYLVVSFVMIQLSIQFVKRPDR